MSARVDRLVATTRLAMLGALVVLLLLLATLLATRARAQSRVERSYYEAEQVEFQARWNAVGERWNAAADDLRKGLYPAAKLRELDRAFARLRTHKMWVKSKEDK